MRTNRIQSRLFRFIVNLFFRLCFRLILTVGVADGYVDIPFAKADAVLRENIHTGCCLSRSLGDGDTGAVRPNRPVVFEGDAAHGLMLLIYALVYLRLPQDIS